MRRWVWFVAGVLAALLGVVAMDVLADWVDRDWYD
jgi:hypothetical protein